MYKQNNTAVAPRTTKATKVKGATPFSNTLTAVKSVKKMMYAKYDKDSLD